MKSCSDLCQGTFRKTSHINENFLGRILKVVAMFFPLESYDLSGKGMHVFVCHLPFAVAHALKRMELAEHPNPKHKLFSGFSFLFASAKQAINSCTRLRSLTQCNSLL